ncbi:ATP synthase subunit I [Oxalobacter sp. OttesenSCG-928-P03]|nr:ATP synthase subunit I [Oxalobacter sp. OttesenSCG-928-P03]
MKWARIVFLQLMIAAITALIAVLLGGTGAGISSALASTSCIVPNMVMFSGFYINDHVLKKSGFAALFVLELVKIALTIMLVIAAIWLYRDVNWISFFVSFLIALKSYIFLLSKIKN